MVPLLLSIACHPPGPAAESSGSDSSLPSDTADTSSPPDTSDTEDVWDTDHSDEIGEPRPGFALVDLNPNSSTHGQVVDTAALAGQPFAVVFIDSRCSTAHDIPRDLWGAYEAHAGWWEALPTFAIESASAYENLPESVAKVTDGNPVPYLLDTEQAATWVGYGAANHDMFVLSGESTLDAWLPLYSWPDDLEMFTEYMLNRFGG